MGFPKSVKKLANKSNENNFFNELDKQHQEDYFSFSEKKYFPTIDNIYYSIFFKGDSNENENLTPLFEELEIYKSMAIQNHKLISFKYGLSVDVKSYKLYKYCLTEPDLYDIFILNYLPNKETPRVLVQIRALGLWTKSIDEMLINSYNHVEQLFSEYGCEIGRCRENRIDYCYHTNIISNPEKTFKDSKVEKQLKTSLEKWQQNGHIEKTEDKTILHKDYFALGSRNSNSVFVRMYDKTREVIEQGYKNFFFELWYKNGLINFYDKYCLEYAYTSGTKDYDYIHKGKLLFYLEYGTDEEKKQEFEAVLNDKNATMEDIKKKVNGYMPDITTIMNVEFETKRKFYYYSDKFIKDFIFTPREGLPTPLTWLFKIVDNRAVFLDYLTSNMVCFKKNETEYTDWWNRLRTAKFVGNKANEKLLRDYTQELDEKLIKVKFVNSVATTAVYNDNVDTKFIEDISDVLSNINDNQAHKASVSMLGADGGLLDEIESSYLKYYSVKKEKKEMQLKNRKRVKNG